jgi:hypothetical protein
LWLEGLCLVMSSGYKPTTNAIVWREDDVCQVGM